MIFWKRKEKLNVGFIQAIAEIMSNLVSILSDSILRRENLQRRGDQCLSFGLQWIMKFQLFTNK